MRAVMPLLLVALSGPTHITASHAFDGARPTRVAAAIARLKGCLARESAAARIRHETPEHFAVRAQHICLPAKRDAARAKAVALVAAGFTEAPDLVGAVEQLLSDHERETAEAYARSVGRRRVAGGAEP
ncbi:hypothetical protein NS228_08870 [Methylobacterium indicum]|uniref:Uncharacterized protein n=1 Tax=Methylobacterium indicum TaxID=1775910 RepID=A0A0J6UD11_9HYPH|nr:hypothetical protein [Methylobacterium indicum]KMO23616.1 hypothetical protein QR78_03670 [Methylobacterium indicum]KMO24159.1 hypothetical protein QR79_12280 [Methylobacterium indicum]KTS15685.1 hypothetical protein NS229_27615 [Methylobacterium indicum]KTS40896.1 hypothetical protein NS228_08870 [Methylobacterium indicum]KTS51886.1 hypothetical protein NS230_12635 [Methylobacterium indicum]